MLLKMKAEIKYAAAVVEMTTTGRMLSFIILKTMSATVKIEITQKLYSGKESFPNTVQREAYAVSYTHLDVYKRQR